LTLYQQLDRILKDPIHHSPEPFLDRELAEVGLALNPLLGKGEEEHNALQLKILAFLRCYDRPTARHYAERLYTQATTLLVSGTVRCFLDDELLHAVEHSVPERPEEDTKVLLQLARLSRLYRAVATPIMLLVCFFSMFSLVIGGSFFCGIVSCLLDGIRPAWSSLYSGLLGICLATLGTRFFLYGRRQWSPSPQAMQLRNACVRIDREHGTTYPLEIWLQALMPFSTRSFGSCRLPFGCSWSHRLRRWQAVVECGQVAVMEVVTKRLQSLIEDEGEGVGLEGKDALPQKILRFAADPSTGLEAAYLSLEGWRRLEDFLGSYFIRLSRSRNTTEITDEERMLIRAILAVIGRYGSSKYIAYLQHWQQRLHRRLQEPPDRSIGLQLEEAIHNLLERQRQRTEKRQLLRSAPTSMEEQLLRPTSASIEEDQNPTL